MRKEPTRFEAFGGVALFVLGCGKTATRDVVAVAPAPPLASLSIGVEVPTAGHLLTIAEARRYMVKLVNRDRASLGLSPVELDEGSPTAAGQAHAEDMASHGFLGHWGTDGSIPEQRSTESGGVDAVFENASCFTDEKPRTLDGSARIDPAEIDKTEAMFFNETPPNDGHRKNILKPFHNRVGIGVAQPRATPTEIPVPCFSQEFVDAYGSYGPVPRRARVGDPLTVQGTLSSPARLAGVGLARVETPHPITVSDLNRRRSYPVPPPFQMYWPQGFVTPIPLAVRGNEFAITVPLSDQRKPGLYEVSVWARLPGVTELIIVGLRTLRVE